MGKILAIANQKGGVGKTTTCINLSAALVQRGLRVLLVDIDPQGNATGGVGIKKGELKLSLYDVLCGKVSAEEVLKTTSIPSLDILPSSIHLAGAEVELVGVAKREFALRDTLLKVKDHYDYVLIDCPPSLGLLTLNALTAAHGVLVPIQCEFYALEGLSQLLNTIRLIKQHLNPPLEVEGVVLTMYNARTNLSAQVAAEVKKFFSNKVYGTVIPRNIRLAEAPGFGLPITVFDPKSPGADAYMALADELLGHKEEL